MSDSSLDFWFLKINFYGTGDASVL